MDKKIASYYSTYLQHHAANLGRTIPDDLTPNGARESITLELRFAVALAAIDSRGPSMSLKTYQQFADALALAVPRS